MKHWVRKKGTIKQYSLAKKLKQESKISIEFEVMVNNLSLEELIGLKLELASKAAGGKLYGIPIWKSLPDISKEAAFLYAISACTSKREAAVFLGIDLQTFNKMQKKFDSQSYFKDLNNLL